MPTFECDVCIVGGGISAALLSQKVSELRPGASIIVVEAGERLFDLKKRMLDRQRSMAYGENPWPGDYVEDQSAQGVISRTMAVGGSALHWGGVTNRFSQEDLRLKSMYGLAADWPIEWAELERYYCEAERRIGVSAENGPFPEDKPSQPYPMPVMPLSWNLLQLKAWAEKSGVPFGPTPQAKNTVPYDGRSECKRCNTCEMCPTGARYSPDETFRRLLAAKKIQLHDRTLVRRLVTAEGGGSTPAIVSAEARHRDRPDEPVEYRARTFVVAAGYCWSPHLLLASRLQPLSRRPGQPYRQRRPLYGRPRIHPGADRARRGDLSGHQRSAQPPVAPVLPLRDGQTVRASRLPDLGERIGPRSQAEGCGRQDCSSATRSWPTGARVRSAAPRACGCITTCIPPRTAR